MTTTILIREIPASAVYSVRLTVLRPGRPLAECVFEGDTIGKTFHLGLFMDENLIGVASFMQNSNPLFKEAEQYQLRGMAVLSEFKGQGFGTSLLIEGQEKLKNLVKHPFLWFNARDSAIEFYKKFGYQTIGEEFDVPGVCIHIVMFKQL
ncbi:MAG: GNAT family N-acetyltransferase [Flavobacteriaceae bacterium]|nr:GNAT family N-acetyltransferase [Flavobacteriaceae bacterium]